MKIGNIMPLINRVSETLHHNNRKWCKHYYLNSCGLIGKEMCKLTWKKCEIGNCIMIEDFKTKIGHYFNHEDEG